MELFILTNFNYITIGAILGFVLLIWSSRLFSETVNHRFWAIAGLLLVIDCAEMLYSVLQSEPGNQFPIHLTYIVSNSLKPIIVLLLIAIVQRQKQIQPLMWLPIIINSLLYITNPSAHWIYSLGTNYQYLKGPFPYSAQLIAVLYLAYLINISLHMYKHHSLKEGIFLVYLGVFTTIAVVLETVYRFDFLLPGTIISACMLYYSFLSAQIYQRDELTGLLNRRSFFQACQSFKNEIFPIISIDMNGLKDINDLEGHQAGDIALQTLAEILNRHATTGYFVYRMGGDEFMVLAHHHSTVEAQQFINNTKASLALTRYAASFGLALYTPGADFDDICNQADTRMYQDKRNFRHRVKAQHPTQINE